MKNLIQGIQNFAKTFCYEGAPYNDQVSQGQSAKILVIGCCDALVDPVTLMNAPVGSIFVHRNIAALVPPCEQDDMTHYHGTSAVLEFAVLQLKVEHIIVLGHGNCGGIRALLTDSFLNHDGFLHQWMMIASPAKEALETAGSLTQTNLELESIKTSLQNLMTFPWVQEKCAAGTLKLSGLHFDRGHLRVLDEKGTVFKTVDQMTPNK